MSPSPFSRRKFIKMAAAGGLGASLVSGCSSGFDWQAFFQQRFQEMSPAEIARVLARLEEKYARKYGASFSVSAAPAVDNTLFGFGVDLSKCIGCRKCVYACVEENNTSREIAIQYIRVIRMPAGFSELTEGEHYYDPPEVPEEDFYYLPVTCQHCENPPCVKVCPVKAMWTESDGMVVIDYDWCIGCRDCMAACPYRAIKFNWTPPVIPVEELNLHTHFLSNRPRVRGVVEKCHGCLHRTRKGLYPACVAACPTGAWKFGNLLDPESEIRGILDRFRAFKLKNELNTEPKCFYYFSIG